MPPKAVEMLDFAAVAEGPVKAEGSSNPVEPAEPPEADAATLENQTVFHGEQDDGDHDEIATAFPETKTEIGTTLELLHRLIEETAGANDDVTTVPCWLSVLF